MFFKVFSLVGFTLKDSSENYLFSVICLWSNDTKSLNSLGIGSDWILQNWSKSACCRF